MNLSRYSRQTVLPQVGVAGQKALLKSKVLLVGAGGLGIPCAQSLVAAGIGHLTIIDDDRVSLSNLQRQFLFKESDIGRPKVIALKEKLAAQNSEVTIRNIEARLNVSNIMGLVSEHDLVIDGSDNFATKFLINDACLIARKPWVYGSVSRFEGQVAVFSAGVRGDHSCYRCLYEKMPNSKIENCEEQGVFGAVTGIIGNYQALEALKVLMSVDGENPANNKLKTNHNILNIFDFHSMDQQCLFVPKRASCSCHQPHLIQLKEEASLVCSLDLEKNWKDFERDLNRKMLIDVRTLEEYETGHHENGILWSDEILQKISSENVGQIYLYCATGRRAKLKCLELQSQGIKAYYIL